MVQDLSYKSVKVAGVLVERPSSMSVTKWLAFWERAMGMPYDKALLGEKPANYHNHYLTPDKGDVDA
jgi:hypothetical protein